MLDQSIQGLTRKMSNGMNNGTRRDEVKVGNNMADDGGPSLETIAKYWEHLKVLRPERILRYHGIHSD